MSERDKKLLNCWFADVKMNDKVTIEEGFVYIKNATNKLYKLILLIYSSHQTNIIFVFNKPIFFFPLVDLITPKYNTLPLISFYAMHAARFSCTRRVYDFFSTTCFGCVCIIRLSHAHKTRFVCVQLYV